MTARGVCVVCGSLRALRNDGRLRGHWQAGTSHRCPGSGDVPATREQAAALDAAFADRPGPWS